MSGRTFADFPISPEVLQGLTAMGYADATPVQAQTIDPALAGRDLIVRAKTGTGKTAAFCVPIVERIAEGEHRTRAIVLSPTRELAIQIAQECAAIAKFKDLRICAIYGGVGFESQVAALKEGSEIVVGTPGRILDHIRRGNLDLSGVQFAVLDEADEMLSMGFLEDVRKILDKCQPDRQTLLFSATVNESIRGLIGRYTKDALDIMLSYDGDNVQQVTHILYESNPDYHKARALLDLIEKERPKSAIIFCNTKEDVSTVCSYLERQGMNAEMISGDLPQKQRERVMARVKAGATQFLVATDVAARGIDISDLSHVINYALPDDPAVYLHRSGRTGRIGKTGVVLNLAGGADFSSRISLERIHKIQFDVRQMPTPEESATLRAERVSGVINQAAGSTAYESWLDAAKRLKERPDADKLIAVMIRAFMQFDAKRRAELIDRDNGSGGIDESPERPSRDRDDRSRRDGPRDDRGPRRDDRGARDDRPRDDRPARDDRPRDDRPARDDRPRDDAPREARPPRDDRPREDRPRRDDRPREDRPRAEQAPTDTTRPAREDRPPREARPPREPRPERARPAVEPPRADDAVAPADAPPGAIDEADEDTLDGADAADVADGTEAGEAAKKKRRRRRRRPAGAAAAAEPTAAE